MRESILSTLTILLCTVFSVSAQEKNIDDQIHQWLKQHQCEILAQTGNVSGWIMFEYQEIDYSILYDNSDSEGFFTLTRTIKLEDNAFSWLKNNGILTKYVEDLYGASCIKFGIVDDKNMKLHHIDINCSMYTFGNEVDPFLKKAIKSVNTAYELFRPYYRQYKSDNE